jgi:hypothetical protein
MIIRAIILMNWSGNRGGKIDSACDREMLVFPGRLWDRSEFLASVAFIEQVSRGGLDAVLAKPRVRAGRRARVPMIFLFEDIADVGEFRSRFARQRPPVGRGEIPGLAVAVERDAIESLEERAQRLASKAPVGPLLR